MSGTIIINQDDPWIAATWVYSYIMERTAEYIPPNSFPNLRLLMNEDENPMCLIVADKLSQEERKVFFDALRRAYDDILREDGKSFADREFYNGFLERYRELLNMIPP